MKEHSLDTINELVVELENKSKYREIKITALVSSSKVNYGLSRILRSLANLSNFPTIINVFRDNESAKAWLLRPGPMK